MQSAVLAIIDIVRPSITVKITQAVIMRSSL